MSKCDACPIKDGECFGERHAFACKFAGPDANPTQRRFLADQSARLRDAPPAEPPVYPSTVRMAANLVGSAVRFLASGGATVPREEYERRRAICLACPSGRYDAEQDRCTACGCYASVKPWGKAESCPEGHW